MADQTEQTTLVHNEEEAFALEPIDITGNMSFCLKMMVSFWKNPLNFCFNRQYKSVLSFRKGLYECEALNVNYWSCWDNFRYKDKVLPQKTSQQNI